MKYVFAADSYGVINSLLINMGLIVKPINWLGDANYTMASVLIVTIWSSFGLGFLAFTAGLQGLDRAYYEAAAIDGLKNRLQELYYVTLPQMWPQLMFAAVTSIANAFNVGTINGLMTGNPSVAYSTATIKLHMEEVGATRFEMGYGASISIVLFCMMQITWTLIKKLLGRFNEE
jgi:multiple sugar transport system permease protein